MKTITIVMLLFFYSLVIASDDEYFLTQEVNRAQTIHDYNRIRNDFSDVILQADVNDIRFFIAFANKTRKGMDLYSSDFSKEQKQDMDKYISELEDYKLMKEELERCQLEPEYDLVRRDISAMTGSKILGENSSKGCSQLEKSAYDFPELNSIKEVGTELSKRSMARQVHEKLMEQHVDYYLNALYRYKGELPSLSEVKKKACKRLNTVCSLTVSQRYKKFKKNNKNKVNFKNLSADKKEIMTSEINQKIQRINELVKKLKDKTPENESILTVGGNDFLLPCGQQETEANQLYREYQAEIENLVTPKSTFTTDIIKSELAISMLYSDIGIPAVPETECNEKGYQEITFDEHEKITQDDLENASIEILESAADIVKTEQSDFGNGTDPTDYIGEKSSSAPHMISSYLAQNPQSVALVCDGLKDFESDEKWKGRAKTAANVLTGLTAVTGLGGLGMIALRSALWAGGKALGKSAINSIRKTGVTQFSKRNSKHLLSSKTATVGYGTVAIADSAILTDLYLDEKKDIEKINANILSMPESKSKDKLYQEFQKASELEFDLKLSLGFGLLDVAGLVGLMKLSDTADVVINEAKADELANYLSAKREQIEAFRSNPDYDVIRGLRYLMPEEQYKKLMAEIFNNLSKKDMEKFSVNYKVNLAQSEDFLTALNKTLKEMKLDDKVYVPTQNEMNRALLANIPESQMSNLVVEMTTKYDDIIKKHGFNDPAYENEVASILYLLSRKHKSENLPWEKSKEAIDKQLGKLAKANCSK